ncbi:MAG: hypothetical protein JO319_11850 [Acidobacteriaceae bacterium]|nr:hypothetical protein [Acidobacteriaceae bacterium]
MQYAKPTIVFHSFILFSFAVAFMFIAGSVCADAADVKAPTALAQTGADCSAAQSAMYSQSQESAQKAEANGNIGLALEQLKTSAAALGSCRLQARAEVQIGRLELREGHFGAAEATAQHALLIDSAAPALMPVDRGLAHFVLASAYAGSGQYRNAAAAYLQSAHFFESCGPQGASLTARVYSDLSVMYAQAHQLKEADEAMAKSMAAGRNTATLDPVDDILMTDTESHIDYQEGKVSEALNRIKLLLSKYGNKPAISATLRAHLYEDYGSLCSEAGKLDDAVEFFKVSVGLRAISAVATGMPRTLALLARVQILQHQYDQAMETLQNAKRRVETLADGNPFDAAVVSEIYGSLLIAKQQWSDARTELLHTLSMAPSSAAFTNVRAAALQQLITADHHLHLRNEEKQVRKQAREVEAQLVYPGSGNVVDVLTLTASYSAEHR